MINSAQSLKDKAKNIAKEKGVTVQEVIQNYMFERFLERLSVSDYKDNFILKGGLLLSSIIGIDTRTTVDIDTCLKGIKLEEEKLHLILDNILSINLNDSVTFKLLNTKPIKEEDEYNGLKFKMLANFDGLKVHLSIDIATGDIITPREILYKYKLLFENRSINLMAYNLETIIAEKFQAVIARDVLNSRMKDYYDLYYLITHKRTELSDEVLTKAINTTFKKRETAISDVSSILEKIRKSDFLQDLWESYKKSHEFAKGIKYQDIMEKLSILDTLVN